MLISSRTFPRPRSLHLPVPERFSNLRLMPMFPERWGGGPTLVSRANTPHFFVQCNKKLPPKNTESVGNKKTKQKTNPLILKKMNPVNRKPHSYKKPFLMNSALIWSPKYCETFNLVTSRFRFQKLPYRCPQCASLVSRRKKLLAAMARPVTDKRKSVNQLRGIWTVVPYFFRWTANVT